MNNFELSPRLAFGQYLPTGSVIHGLDPRIKLASAAALLAALVASNSSIGLTMAIVTLMGLTVLARVPLRYVLKSLRAAWPFILLVTVLQLFAFSGNQGACQTLVDWTFLHITTCAIPLAVASLLRFVGLALLIHLLTLSTSITEVTRGVTGLLRPLARIGFPAYEIALILALALRFVPLLAEETERLMKAQAARGADFTGRHGGIIRRVRSLLPLLVPLFVNSLNRAEDLALAMEARCYGASHGRTSLIRLRARKQDYVALGLSLILSTIIVWIPFS